MGMSTSQSRKVKANSRLERIGVCRKRIYRKKARKKPIKNAAASTRVLFQPDISFFFTKSFPSVYFPKFY